MATSLSPFVYWSQDKDIVYLKVDLRDVENSDVQIADSAIGFEGIGDGARGKNLYKFSMDLYDNIDVNRSSYNVTQRNVDVKLVKKPADDTASPSDRWWPRLTLGRNRPIWLRVDFDRWRDPPGYEDEPPASSDMMDYFDQENQEAAADRIAKDIMRGAKADGFEVPRFRTMYLITYNSLLSLGFIAIFIELLVGFARKGTDYFPDVWPHIGLKWIFCQAAQWLELFHVLVRYTPGSPMAPLMQNFSRSLVLSLIWFEPRMQDKPFVFYLFVVWAGIEIVRYPYYLSVVLDKPVSFLTWLRYTLWIPLYPTGITIEGIIILRSIAFFQETDRFKTVLFDTIPLDISIFLGLYILVGLLPGGLYLINMMRNQRRAKLGPVVKKKKTSLDFRS